MEKKGGNVWQFVEDKELPVVWKNILEKRTEELDCIKEEIVKRMNFSEKLNREGYKLVFINVVNLYLDEEGLTPMFVFFKGDITQFENKFSQTVLMKQYSLEDGQYDKYVSQLEEDPFVLDFDTGDILGVKEEGLIN